MLVLRLNQHWAILRCAVCSARQQSTDLEVKQMSVQRGDRNLLKFQG